MVSSGSVEVMEDRTAWGCVGERNRGTKILDRDGQTRWCSGHIFYRKLNQLLAEHGFDRFIEDLCLPFYEPTGSGRPSIPPGVYFRMLFVGYFEGSIHSVALLGDVKTAYRCGVPRCSSHRSDARSLDADGIRKRLPQEIHDQVFVWVLQLAANKKLLWQDGRGRFDHT